VLDQFANVVRIALSAEEILPKRIYRLTDFVESATFSHVQCAALLARMFFKPKTSHSLSFHYLLEHDDELSIEKLRFLFAYFDRIATNPPKGCVSFRLKTVRNEEFKEEWIKNKCNPMPDVRIYDQMVIEETALCTQIDFANEYLGGGVLKSGAEEIRFLMCPEMIVGMLLTDKMDDTQAISIVGAYVYSGYTGYANKLKWRPLSGRYARQNDARLRDKYGRLRVETVAIDAMYFKTKAIAEQVTSDSLTREMKKAYTGFAQSEHFGQIPIVTGFWGCGAFNGHKPLKFLIQLMAASIAGRPLQFCIFGDTVMGNKCRQMKRRLEMDNVTVG
ncbi:LOW QUALITY PROTEIN: Protein CBR-PME-3, partial [Caenorhabditis briggsae]